MTHQNPSMGNIPDSNCTSPDREGSMLDIQLQFEMKTYRVRENKNQSKSEYGQYSWLQLYVITF